MNSVLTSVGTCDIHGHAMSPQHLQAESDVKMAPGQHSIEPHKDVHSLEGHGLDSISSPEKEQGGYPYKNQAAINPCVSSEEINRVIELPSGIDIGNIVVNRKGGRSLLGLNWPRSAAPISSYAFRRRSVEQTRLVYDIKYHPMDDSVRPANTAKRRSAYIEKLCSSNGLFDTLSEQVNMDTKIQTSIIDESETKTTIDLVAMSTKRNRNIPQPLGAIRRSSRKASNRNISYNMNIHPQDGDLEMLNVEHNETQILLHKRASFRHALSTIELGLDDKKKRTAKPMPSKTTQATNLAQGEDMADGYMPVNIHVEMSSRVNRGSRARTSRAPLAFSSSAPYRTRRKVALDVRKFYPRSRDIHHFEDPWPVVSGQPFEVYAERLEDQLGAEAMSVSPLNYIDDDKENKVNNPDLVAMPGSPQSISVMPALQYTEANEHSHISRHMPLVSHALYSSSIESPQPYGLGLEQNDMTSN
ncbi:hypothetical protein BKA66DRAFT_195743 [Pyrenochaeta sp. MPI-SDFR-AT-0127]|nr:hypothetical protein BKA66DRAFT_195743 [Pyrenochaeta sp. MPI-SDFR-AT-0127]